MALGQFNERVQTVETLSFPSTYTPGTATAFGTQATNDKQYDQLIATNTDAANHVVTLYDHTSGGNVIIATVTVPAGSGTGATPPVDLLASLFDSGHHYIQIAQNHQLYASMADAPAASTVVNIYASGGIF